MLSEEEVLRRKAELEERRLTRKYTDRLSFTPCSLPLALS